MYLHPFYYFQCHWNWSLKNDSAFQTLLKENYRPVSILSHVSKIFERLVFNRIEKYFESIFSNVLTGFQKNHRTQNALFKMIELWKKALEKWSLKNDSAFQTLLKENYRPVSILSHVSNIFERLPTPDPKSKFRLPYLINFHKSIDPFLLKSRGMKYCPSGKTPTN